MVVVANVGLSYDPTKLSTPATITQEYLNAILVELRAIRIAIQKQNEGTLPQQSTMTAVTPVVTKKTK